MNALQRKYEENTRKKYTGYPSVIRKFRHLCNPDLKHALAQETAKLMSKAKIFNVRKIEVIAENKKI